jgi:signal transduction histidine kinase
MDKISHMIDCALDGNFTEDIFDESKLSSLETKFADYLYSSQVSSQAVAREKDKIKTMISDISHQTKTPIANLLLYSELLEEEPLNESAQGSVLAIHTQAQKLKFLIDSLVKLSRLENGILSLTPKQEHIQPMLQNVYEQFLPVADKKGLGLYIEETDILANFDVKWTTEALCNLVDNAIKYTNNGSVKISVTSYEMFVRIDVTDTGIGIVEDEYAKIFARFYRGENVRNSEGVGVGLYLAREIVAGEGGYIKVSSVIGEGSTFSIFLQNCKN